MRMRGILSGPTPWLVLAVALCGGAALAHGDVSLHVGQAVADLWAGRRSAGAIILGELRLPRLLLAVFVGGTLGVSGAVLQAYFRNPLADSGVLGISGGGALGAVLVYYTGLSARVPLAMPGAGLLGALGATALLLALSGVRAGPGLLVLAGAALSSLFASLLALTLNLVPSPYAAYEVMHWLMGSLADRTLHDVAIAAPGIALGLALLFASGPALDALTLGDEVATSMGAVRSGPFGTQTRIVLGVALSVGSAVAVTGTIGFVGLMVPHLLRAQTGNVPSRLLVPSFFGGALLLLIADWLTRLIGGATVQIGVVTALAGAPVFLWQVLRLRRSAL
jgi:iron complex transport system permease protein